MCRHLRSLYTDENKIYIHIGLGTAAFAALSFVIYKIIRSLRWRLLCVSFLSFTTMVELCKDWPVVCCGSWMLVWKLFLWISTLCLGWEMMKTCLVQFRIVHTVMLRVLQIAKWVCECLTWCHVDSTPIRLMPQHCSSRCMLPVVGDVIFFECFIRTENIKKDW